MKNDYFIRVLDGRETVGNGHRGTCLHEPLQRILYKSLTFCIKCACGFVENKYRRILEYGSCNTYTLALTTGKSSSTISDIGFESVFGCHNEIICVGNFSSLYYFFFRGTVYTECYVIVESVVEKDGFLVHISDKFSE